MYDLQDIIRENTNAVDKTVRGQLLSQIDRATSFRDHLKMNADFYRKQPILSNAAKSKYPVDPEREITEP